MNGAGAELSTVQGANAPVSKSPFTIRFTEQTVGVLVGVFVGVFVGVLVGVFVGVFVGVLVGVLVGVFVGVLVGVEVLVLVAVLVLVVVGVGVLQVRVVISTTFDDVAKPSAPTTIRLLRTAVPAPSPCVAFMLGPLVQLSLLVS